MICCFKLPVWIAATSPDEAICRGLQFSYGVFPVHAEHPLDWKGFARSWVQSKALPEELIVMAEYPSQLPNPHLEIIDLRCGDAEEVHIPCQ